MLHLDIFVQLGHSGVAVEAPCSDLDVQFLVVHRGNAGQLGMFVLGIHGPSTFHVALISAKKIVLKHICTD
jgi:hypothetical protein